MWIFYGRDTVYTGDQNYLNKVFYKRIYGDLGSNFNTSSNRCNDFWIKEYILNELSGTVKHVVYDSITGCSSSANKIFHYPNS